MWRVSPAWVDKGLASWAWGTEDTERGLEQLPSFPHLLLPYSSTPTFRIPFPLRKVWGTKRWPEI